MGAGPYSLDERGERIVKPGQLWLRRPTTSLVFALMCFITEDCGSKNKEQWNAVWYDPDPPSHWHGQISSWFLTRNYEIIGTT